LAGYVTRAADWRAAATQFAPRAQAQDLSGQSLIDQMGATQAGRDRAAVATALAPQAQIAHVSGQPV